MQRILWWNVCNLFDDHDDPHTDDFVRDQHAYLRDIKEITHIIAGLTPQANLIGLGEIENLNVINELIEELRWKKRHHDYRCPTYFESRDPRGIDVGCLYHPHHGLQVDRVEACYPSHQDAVRPVIVMHVRINNHFVQLAFLHSKSRRSGDAHRLDSTPGSHIRFSYAHLLRKLALDAGSKGIGFLAMGDFNDEPKSLSLTHGARAWIGRPQKAHQLKDHRLYNLSLEMQADAQGSHCYHGSWAFLDQVLVNGVLLREEGVHIQGRPQLLTHGPLLYRGEPNRWYSDHLPVSVCLAVKD